MNLPPMPSQSRLVDTVWLYLRAGSPMATLGLEGNIQPSYHAGVSDST
jgi:hypothetical protein